MVVAAAAANLQVEQMKLGAAAGGWPMRLATMLPLGRMFCFGTCACAMTRGGFSKSVEELLAKSEEQF